MPEMSDQDQIEMLQAWAYWKRLALDKYAAQQSTDEIWESENNLVASVQFVLARIQELEVENARLRWVCAEAYQMAGAYDAPVKALDNLAAAAGGKPLPHKTFLPIDAPEPREGGE